MYTHIASYVKIPGPKSIVAPSSARQDVFIRKGIVVSARVICYPVHLTDGLFTEKAFGKITPLSQEVNLNRTNKTFARKLQELYSRENKITARF